MVQNSTSLVQATTPYNLEAERSKFFSSKVYNPVFKYIWQDRGHELSIDAHPEKMDLFSAILGQDSGEIVKQARLYFQTELEEESLRKAKKILETKPDKPPEDEGYVEAAEGFNRAFAFFDLSYEALIVDAHGFNFRPSYTEGKIYVSKYANMENFSVDGAVRHEISHFVRYENGKANQIENEFNFLATEEGLASYVQDSKSDYGESSLYQHAAEYVATEIGLIGSLRDVYDFFVSKGFDTELSWQRAARHKFGFTDTSVPGDIMKPAMYFFNEQKVASLSKGEIARLYVGKIGMGSLLNYPEYKGRINREQIVTFFKLDE